MIYFDAAYIAKCYLNEPGAERVRAVAHDAAGLASCELARLEFICTVHRHVREGNLTARGTRGPRRFPRRRGGRCLAVATDHARPAPEGR